jgi:diguanylate cyclase (GGDEF)-like protein/PAS domain S-box-containing protein
MAGGTLALGLLDAAPDAMVVVDGDGSVVLVNRQVEVLFGYRRDELIGRPVETLMPERFRDGNGAHRAAVWTAPLDRETGSGLELFAVRKDGTEFPVEISLSPLQSENGPLVTAAIRDVTERKAVEDRLAETARQLKEAQSVAQLGSWSWSVVDDRVEWSEELCHIFGIEPVAAPENLESYVALVHPGDRELARGVVGRALETGEPYEFDHRITRPGGEVRWVNGRGRVVRDGRGRPIQIHGTAQDVTDKRAADAALRAAQERFRRAFEDSAVGMALVGLEGEDEGRFLEVNRALCEITGYEPDQLRESQFIDLIHSDHVDRIRRLARQLQAREITTMQSELLLLGFAGSLCWVAVNASLVTGADGVPMHAVIQVQDVSERKRFEGQLQYLADHDSLTGLFNRRRFEAELEREFSSSLRYGTGGAVIVLDIDNFKYVNDSAGHAAGDELLSGVAAALHRRLRATDTIARVGGDEFGIILPHVDEHRARLVAEDLRRTVHEGLWVGDRLEAGRATVSIGVAMFGKHPRGVTGEDLLVEADVAMYESKEAGRNRIRVYDPTTDRRQRMEASLKWADRIRTALEESRFALYAQPIAPLQGAGRPHYELLVRMLDENGDVVPPGAFLSVAERCHLIEEVDRWVIAEAIEALAREQQGGNDVLFEVNLSATSAGDPELPGWIAGRLAHAGADGHGLVFEMTETEAIVNVEGVRTFAERMRALGCGFALDDFGAGFASFYYLKHLSFDYLKIDGEFIQDLPRNRTDQMVVRAVVEIARGLGKRTIAEFVGDRETLELLRELDVDYAQGYWLGRPRPLDEIRAETGVVSPV